MTNLRKIQIVLWLLVVAAGLGAAALASGVVPLPGAAPIRVEQSMASVSGPFRLTTHKGQTFTEADLRGKPFLVFFGFANCPDVCPTTLNELSSRFESIGHDADKLTALLITVDPDRDTQDALAQYMEAFDSRLIALRGNADETAAIIKSYKAYVKKVSQQNGDYTMDHAAIVYMMDVHGRFVGTLDPHEGETVQLTKLRRLVAGQTGS